MPSLLALALPLALAAAPADDRTLLVDHTDTPFVPQPRQGKVYPAAGHIDPAAGRVRFRVRLDFDPKPGEVPAVLRNQFFWTVAGPGRSRVRIYSVLKSVCVGIWDERGQLVLYTALASPWKRGQWHDVSLCWGRRLVFSCDGKHTAKPWSGLFGPMVVQPADLRIQLGVGAGGGIENRFALQDLRILGPGGACVPDRPLFVVPRLAEPPTVDGRLGPGEWDAAARTGGFVGLTDPALVEDQTAVYMAYDDARLYVAYDCRDPKERPLVGRLIDRDTAVWTEDAVDLFLQPWGKTHPYYQIVVSCRGTLSDHRCVDPATHTRRVQQDFNPAVQVKTSQSAGRYVVELAVPFAELDGKETPRDGERWRVNFCRDAAAAGRLSSWAYTGGNFHRTEAFGEVVFRDDDRTLRLEQIDGWAGGRLEAQWALAGRSLDPAVEVTAAVIDAGAKPVATYEERLTDARLFRVAPDALTSGTYALRITAASRAGRPILHHRVPFRVEKPFDVVAEAYPYAGKLWVTASAGGLVDAHTGLVARVELRQGETVHGRCTIERFQGGRGQAAIDIAQLEPGTYDLVAEALAGGKAVASVTYPFRQRPRPRFWLSEAGIDHSVPEPWTPPTVDQAGTVGVWGRQYRCGDGVVPAQIVNQGRDAFGREPTWTLRIDGRTVELAALGGGTTVASPPDRVVREVSTRAGSTQVRLRATTEFDGLVRYDLTIAPRGKATIERLAMSLPVRKELATFMLASTGRSSRTAEIGPEGWHAAFHPLVWLGNDDVGLAWFSPSDQYWTPRDDRMVEVRPAGDVVVLHLGMVRSPRTIDGPVTLTCGLVATPVKEAPSGDPFWYRFGRPASIWHVGDPDKDLLEHTEFLTYPGRGNLDPREGTFECWVAPAADAEGTWHEVVQLAGAGGKARVHLKVVKDGPGAVLLRGWREGEPWTIVAGEVDTARMGRWTHVAVAWGEATALFVNGRRAGRKADPMWDAATMAAEPDKLSVRVGAVHPYRGMARIQVDEVRLSKGVRYAESFPPPAEPFRPDADTLLLDHLDDAFRPDGEDGQTRAAVVSGRSDELGGTPSIGCRFVAGRFGKALEVRMHPPRPSLPVLRDRWGCNASLWWAYLPKPQATKTGWPLPLFTKPAGFDQAALTAKLDQAGLATVPYLAYYGLGAPSPVTAQFGAEWRREPKSTLPAPPPPGHYYLACCGGARGFGDYLAEGTRWLMTEQGFDGVYTDGNAMVFPCHNTRHGCGYRDAQGRLRPTWPIFGTREYLKRLYKVVHKLHPRGYIVNHVSYDLFIPVLAFTDVYYTGEHEHYEDLVKCRVRWQGTQWGVWPILLGADAHAWRSLHMTYGLVHGVSVWPQGSVGRNDMMRKTVNVWQAYDAFDYRRAEWVPYYRAERGLVRPRDPQVKASLYLHRGERALVVVGNLTDRTVEPTLTLDLAAMALAEGKLTASNALTGRSLSLSGGTLTVRLRPQSFVLALVDKASRR